MKASRCWARAVVLYSALLLLVGCGPHIQSIRGDFKTVRVTLDDTPPNGLVLMSSSGPVSGPSSSSGRELVFNLPTDDSENAGECLYLADRRGNKLSDSRGYSSFKNEIWTRYLSLREEVISSERRLEQDMALLSKNNYPFSSECPIIRSEKPNDACAPGEEEGVGRLICGVSAFGADFCGFLAADKVPDVLRGASCGVGVGTFMSSALAQKYPVEDQVRDVFLGVIDDISDRGIKSDNIFANILGFYGRTVTTVTKLGIVEQCVRTCQENYKRWQEVPKTLQTACYEVQQLGDGLSTKRSELNQVMEMSGQFKFGCRP